MKNIIIGIALLAVLLGVSVWWSKSLSANDPSVISTSGLHWHPVLALYVKGEQLPIPENIGVGQQYAGMPTYDAGMKMTAMHTHEGDGTIHLEFPGTVRRKDLILGNFFAIWGHDMRSLGSNMRMTVNGVENTEYENYELQDGDNIVLTYD